MARKRRAFSLEYKSEAVRRVGERRLTGATLAQVARELGVRPELLRRWAKEYGGKSRAEVVAAADLEVENRRLRRENETLRQERDFAKIAASFALTATRNSRKRPQFPDLESVNASPRFSD